VRILVIRPHGPHTTAYLGGCSITETSLDHVRMKVSCLPSIVSADKLGTVILEDLHRHDVEESIWKQLRPAMNGSSCPIVSRWTNPDPNA
jgi:hypothetical protein